LDVASTGVAQTAPDAEAVARARDRLVVALTFATGATDAIGVTRLGNVFASVMTGNFVFLGLSVGERSAAVAVHSLVAIFAFMIGAYVGSRIAGHRPANGPIWPAGVTRALALEAAVMAALAVGWEATAGHPTGILQILMLAAAAYCMGSQSGAVTGLGVSGLSSTYMTGTFTVLLSTLAVKHQIDRRSAAILLAIIVGAAVGGVLVFGASRWAGPIPFVVLAGVVLAARTLHDRYA